RPPLQRLTWRDRSRKYDPMLKSDRISALLTGGKMPKFVKIAAIAALMISSIAIAQNASASAAASNSHIIGVGNFSHIVADLDKSLAFYRDVIGLTPTAPPQAFSGNPAIMKLGNTLGAQSRFVALSVPGSAIGVELIDYKDIDRKPAQP